MITIYDLSLEFDENFGFEKSSMVGKIGNDEIAVCFYNSKRQSQPVKALGGRHNSSYGIKALTILLSYTTDSLKAELMAIAIQNYYDERKCRINGRNVYFTLLYNEPIALGTDERGVYEYSFELNVYYERR